MSLRTRASLLVRLRDPTDAVAWSDFVSIYEPVIYRLARSRGLQDADAREVTQDVLISVAEAIERFDLQREGRFGGRRCETENDGRRGLRRPLPDFGEIKSDCGRERRMKNHTSRGMNE